MRVAKQPCDEHRNASGICLKITLEHHNASGICLKITLERRNASGICLKKHLSIDAWLRESSRVECVAVLRVESFCLLCVANYPVGYNSCNPQCQLTR